MIVDMRGSDSSDRPCRMRGPWCRQLFYPKSNATPLMDFNSFHNNFRGCFNECLLCPRHCSKGFTVLFR